MIKQALYEQCQSFVDEKLTAIEARMNSHKAALEQESKSSAGDKHETGRAMVHLEMEKASQQFTVVNDMKETLQKMRLTSNHRMVKLGSLVTTNIGTYFISISAGQLTFNEEVFFAVSTASPIGALLLGKESNMSMRLGSKELVILSID